MTDQPAPRGQRAALGFIFFAVMIDMIAFGITAPVLPRLIRDLAGGDDAMGARWIGWFAAIWALMQFFASPIIGGLSDRYGRRPVLLASMVGCALDFAVMALAPTLAWLVVGRVLSGITASSYSTANAYIADITPEDQRAGRFGVLSAAFGIGFIIGPALGGLLGGVDPRLPFWGAAALSLLNAVYGVFVLPESLPPKNRTNFSFRLANPVGSFSLYARSATLLALGGVLVFYYLAHDVLPTTWAPYAYHRYQWTPTMMGISLAAVGAFSIIVQFFLVGPAVKRFGERGALVAGLVTAAVGFVLVAWAPTGPLVFLSIPVLSLMGLVGPGIQSLLTRHVSPAEQGRLQGANGGIMALTSLGGPILFTELLARAIGPWRGWAPIGLPFLLASVFMGLALLLALGVRPASAPAQGEVAPERA